MFSFSRNIRVWVAFASIWLCAVTFCLRADESTRPQPAEETFTNVQGGQFTLPASDDGPATVLVFLGHECPISNFYSPEIARLANEFASKKVTFCVVYADSELSQDDAAKHARDYKFPCPAILDPKLTLAKRCGAKVKPEAAVLSATGEVLYLGRIDDRYVDFGKRREQPTHRDLRDAVLAVLAGKPVANARTKAIGCDIDFPKEN